MNGGLPSGGLSTFSRRERVHYPTLKTTRAEWRAANGIAA